MEKVRHDRWGRGGCDAGAILAAGAAIGLLVGYLIQRFAFGNPEPTYGTVLATYILKCFNVAVCPRRFCWRFTSDMTILMRLMAWFKRFVEPIVLPAESARRGRIHRRNPEGRTRLAA